MIKLQRFIRTDSGAYSPIGEGYEYEWQTIAIVSGYRDASNRVSLLDKGFNYRIRYSATEIVFVHGF